MVVIFPKVEKPAMKINSEKERCAPVHIFFFHPRYLLLTITHTQRKNHVRMDFVIAGITAFIVVQLLIGIVVSRYIKTEDDYLLAGRKLGMPLATFSIFATWFGAESCIGAAGIAYDEGLAGISSDPFGYALCIFIVGSLFAVKFWKMKLTTIADFVRIRYSRRAERICALLMIPSSFFWTAAQIRAFGTVLSTTTDIALTTGVVAATVVVIMYTSFGGMLADVVTDCIQGCIVIAGLLLLFLPVVSDPESFSFVARSIASHSHNGSSVLATAEQWLIPICGSIFAQELISRVLSSRSGNVARASSLVASGMYFLVGLMPLTIGLVGSTMMPGLDNGEQILPMMAQKYLSSGMYIIFSGAMISAILSTVDSTLLAISGLMSHNILLPLRPDIAEPIKVRVERIVVIAAGLFASVLALYADGVYQLVKDASAFGSAGIFIVIALGMYTRHGDERSATITLLGGALTWIVAYYILEYEYSYIASLIISVIIFYSAKKI